MREVLKHIELIELYCEGKLTIDEKVSFENRLSLEDELKEELRLYKAIVYGIKESGEENLKAKLKIADDELDSETSEIIFKELIEDKNNKNVKSYFVYWSIAASILLIIGLGIVWSVSSKQDLQKIADNNYEKEKGLPITMAANKGKYDDLMNSYKSGDYGSTKKQIEALLKQNSTSDTLNYFNGIINYELKNYEAAISSFSTIANSSIYYDKAQYRLILIDLKLENKEEALGKIEIALKKEENLYYDKLIKLKSELSK